MERSNSKDDGHGAAPLAIVPDVWGPKAATSLADLALTRRGADQIAFSAPQHFFVVLLSQQPTREVRLGGSKARVFCAPAGLTEAIPEGADFFGRWDVPKENILIGLNGEKLNAIAEREFDLGRLELCPQPSPAPDRTATGLSTLIRQAFDDGQRQGRLYLDALSTALVLHLARKHSAPRPATASRRVQTGGLSPKTRIRVEAYLRQQFADDISVGDLAELAGLSYSHFLRAFRITMGTPPHAYLRRIRIEQAERLSETSNLPFGLIAQRTGFSSQSHMTTAMRQATGATPGELRAGKRLYASGWARSLCSGRKAPSNEGRD